MTCLLAQSLKPGRHVTRLPITTILSGDLSLGLHAVVGERPGPTLAVLGCVHGDETLPIFALKTWLDSLDCAQLAGRVAVIPAANPSAIQLFNRQTPEQHGNTDLHTAFPGNAEKGNLTAKLAVAISQHVIDHADALVDIHSGSAARLQNRSDFHDTLPSPLREHCIELCRAFGAPFVHANNLAKTASSYAHGRGIPTCNPEVGGAYLAQADTDASVKAICSGLNGIMAHMGMLPATPKPIPPRQALFGFAHRVEINPGRGGFLNSFFVEPSCLGKEITKGTLLGEVIDSQTLHVVEQLVAPVDGYLFFTRYSGVIDAGTKSYALAISDHINWLE